jgi:hypothetical protein
MNTEPELRSTVRAWLRADEHESAGRVLEGVMSRLDDTPQVRSTKEAFVMVARRMTSFSWLQLGAAGIAVLMLGFVIGAARPGLQFAGSAGASAVARTSDPSTPRYETTIGGTGLHLSIPWPPGWGSWEQKLPTANYLANNMVGSDGAEGLFAWVYRSNAEPCYYLNHRLRAVRDSDPAGLAAAMADAPGIQIVTSPAATKVDGRDARHLVFRVTDDSGCDPGFFYSWPWWFGGAFWSETYPGDTVRIWVVDIEGAPLVLIAATHEAAPAWAESDIQQMVDGLRITAP